MAFVEQSQQAGGLPQRFSLLLLEPGEIYFDDYSVWYFQEPDDADPKRSQQRYTCVESNPRHRCIV